MNEKTDDNVFYVSSSRNAKQILTDTARYPFYMARRFASTFRKYPPSLVCIYNPHPLNVMILRKARHYAPNCIRAIYLHEPSRPGKKSYGFKGRLMFNIIDLTQSAAVAETTDIILPSPYAIELFNESYNNYHGRVHYAPLLLSDNPAVKSGPRRYFSMVGRFNFAKRLDLFVDTINYAAKHKADFDFKIVTSSPIKEYLRNLTPEGKQRLVINHKNNISDEEIAECVSESYAVLCLQPMITQSGVVPVAFMNSTPVIARNVSGFTQYVKHGYNGWVLPDQCNSQNILAAMEAVRYGIVHLSIGAKQTFDNTFSEKNWASCYEWLTNMLTRDD